ncbi:MAG: sugar transferase [Solirubrobacteraceae bacterium]
MAADVLGCEYEPQAVNAPQGLDDGPMLQFGETGTLVGPESDLRTVRARRFERGRQLFSTSEFAVPGVEGVDRTFPGRRFLRSDSAGRALSVSTWRWLQLALDLIALVAVVVVVLATTGAADVSPGEHRLVWLYPLVAVGALALRRMYGPRHGRMIVDTLVGVFYAISLATMAWITAMAFAGLGVNSSPLAARLWVCSILAVGVARSMLLLGHRHALRRGRRGIRTLVVGAGVVGTRLLRNLDQHPEYGVVPVGLLELRPTGDDDGRVPIVGGPEDMLEAATRTRAEHVILAFSNVPDRMLLTQVRHCQEAGIEVSLVPRLFESFNQRIEVTRLGTLPILSLQQVDPRGAQFRMKYTIDRVVAGIALVALLVPLLLVALAVKLTSRGPVLFRQKRVTVDGRVFDLLKFRSMRVYEDGDTPFIPQLGMAPGGIEGADRRTRVGRLLRRTFLDELPQLLNVLRGEMSLVGPRPERPEYVELYEPLVPRYRDRHRARSGITGWAQVHGLRGQTSVTERVEYDNQYIDNWSVGLDLKIMLLTVMAVSSNKND